MVSVWTSYDLPMVLTPFCFPTGGFVMDLGLIYSCTTHLSYFIFKTDQSKFTHSYKVHCKIAAYASTFAMCPTKIRMWFQ